MNTRLLPLRTCRPRALAALLLALTLLTTLSLLTTPSRSDFVHIPKPDQKPKVKCTPDLSYCYQPADLTHLIMVACHSIFKGYNYHDFTNESVRVFSDWLFRNGNWIVIKKALFLQFYSIFKEVSRKVSKIHNRSSCFLGKTLALMSDHKRTWTRDRDRNPWATGYVLFAYKKDCSRCTGMVWTPGDAYPECAWRVFERFLREPDLQARFVLQLMTSICRFYQITGSYPSKITVVGFEFKRTRFTDLHRAALRFPLQKFDYIGINAPHQGPEVVAGEVI